MTKKKPDKLSTLLWGAMKASGTNFDALAEKGLSASTLRNRFNNPDTITRRELHILGRKLGIPIEELRSAV